MTIAIAIAKNTDPMMECQTETTLVSLQDDQEIDEFGNVAGPPTSSSNFQAL